MFLARKELWFSKRRFLLIGFIIVMISWLVLMLSGLGNGLSDLGTAVIRYSEMDLAVFEEEAEFSLSKSTLPESLIDNLAQLDGVEEAAPISTSVGAILQGSNGDVENGKKTSVIFIGIEADSFLEPTVASGEGLQTGEPNQVIMDSSLVNEGFELGDTVTLSGISTEFEIGGFADTQTLNHLPAIYVPIETLREFKYLVPGSDMGIENPVSAVFLKGNNLERETITEAIEGVEVADKKETLNGIPGYTAESGTINLMLWLLVFISAFVIAVFFYVLTTQKVHQFGVMKAIGASNAFVIKTVVGQVFLLSTISILIGAGLTYLTTLFLPAEIPFNLLPQMTVNYSLILLATSMVGSLFSVRSIIKIDPITALGRAE